MGVRPITVESEKEESKRKECKKIHTEKKKTVSTLDLFLTGLSAIT